MDTNTQSTTSERIKLLGPINLIKRAWQFYKTNFKKMWPIFLLGGLGSTITSLRNSHDFGSGISNMSNTLIVGIAVVAVVVILFLVLSKLALLKSISDVRKGQYVGLKDAYKKGFHLFWPYIVLSVTIILAVLGAFFLIIIPGIILSVYLLVSVYEFVDQDKRTIKAIQGSWSLIKGYWWAVLGRVIAILFIFGIGNLIVTMLGFVLIAACSVLLGTKIALVPVVIIVIGIVAFMSLFSAPLVIISNFELYYNLRETRSLNIIADENLDKKRKRKIVICMIIGLVLIILSVLSIYLRSLFLQV